MIHFGNSTRKFIYSCKTPKRITPHQSMQWNQKEEAPVHKLTFLDPKATLKKWCLDNDYSYTLSYQNIERGDNILITCVCEVSFSFANGEDLIGKGEGEKKGIAEKEACLMVCKVLDERGFLADYYEMKDAALKRLKELDGVDDDDEDMYDLTKKVNISVPIEVHGAASHKLAIEIRIEELKGLIDGVEGNVWVDSMEEFDELDAYMANNKDSLKREQLVVWKKELTLKELSMVTIQNEIMLQEQMEDEKRTLNKSRIMEESAMYNFTHLLL